MERFRDSIQFNLANIYESSLSRSQRKKAESALQNNETLFRAVFDNAAVGIAQISIVGRFLQINRELCGNSSLRPIRQLIRLMRDDLVAHGVFPMFLGIVHQPIQTVHKFVDGRCRPQTSDHARAEGNLSVLNAAAGREHGQYVADGLLDRQL